jgi:hypothetical protein
MGFETQSAPAHAANSAGPLASTTKSARRADLHGKTFAEQQAALKPPAAREEQTFMQELALGRDPNEREAAILENDADAADAWVRASAFVITIRTAYAQTSSDPSGSAYLAFMLGERRAKALTDAHEMPGAPREKNTALDRQMDLHNMPSSTRFARARRGTTPPSPGLLSTRHTGHELAREISFPGAWLAENFGEVAVPGVGDQRYDRSVLLQPSGCRNGRSHGGPGGPANQHTFLPSKPPRHVKAVRIGN